MAARTPRLVRPKPPPDPMKLRREGAGRYATGDARFLVEQASNGWMVTDTTQSNELGLPLVRGPYGTLDAARAAVEATRIGPAVVSTLADRIARIPKQAPRPGNATDKRSKAPAAAMAPLPVVLRDFRSSDGEALRALWDRVGFRSLGDDDMSLRRFAQRNPGLFVVVAQGATVIASGMGGWDGRRGWIYHLAVAEDHRRSGIGQRVVRRIEDGLRAVGCPRVNVIVDDGNDAAAAFWEAIGYQLRGSRQMGRDLGGETGSPAPDGPAPREPETRRGRAD